PATAIVDMVETAKRLAETGHQNDFSFQLSAFRFAFPGLTAGEEPMAAGYVLSKEMGYIICDGADEGMGQNLATPSSALTASQYQSQYCPSYGADRPHLFIGGAGSDRISGSMEGDILIGGRGRDSLRGNGGADLFVFCTRSDGNDIIEDFNSGEGDVI